MEKISIVITTTKRFKQLSNLIKSIDNSTKKPEEVIIVIDSDSASYLKEVKSIISTLNIKIIQNQTNLGMAASRNVGAESAMADWVLFVDDDNILHPEMIKNLSNILTEKDIKAVSPMAYYYKGSTNLPEYKRSDVWYAGANLNMKVGKAIYNLNPNKDLYPTDILHNCFIINRKVGDKYGWFEAEMYMVNTELDLLKRMLKDDVRSYIYTKAVTFHDIPHPKDGSESYSRRILPSKKRALYTARNRSLIIKRYGSRKEKLIHFGLFFIPINGYVILSAIYFRKFDYIPYILNGMYQAIKAK